MPADDLLLGHEGSRDPPERQEDLVARGGPMTGAGCEGRIELQPDGALMDIAMPEPNGIEAVKQVKSPSPSTAVLIITGYGDEYVFAVLEAGPRAAC